MPSPSRRRAVRAAAAAGALGLLAFAASPAAPGVRAATEARAAANPVVLRDVRTGLDRLGSQKTPTAPADFVQADTQVEPSIAVNPGNADNVVVGYQEGRVDGGGDATNGFSASFDAGRTWVFGEIPGLTTYPGQGGPFDRASDAVVAFGPGNVAYYSSLVFDSTAHTGGTMNLHSGMAINVSTNGGRTWSQPVFFDDDLLAGLNDKNWVVVDQSDAPGHHKGRVYVFWDRVAAQYYSYCDAGCDQAGNWLPLKVAVIPSYVNQDIGATPLVLPDGSVAVLFLGAVGGVPTGIGSDLTETVNGASNELIATRAPLAGTTPFPAPLVFTPPVTIDADHNNAVRAQRAGSLPTADVDRVSGQMYITWEDGRVRSDGDNGENDILFSTSTDRGLNWSTPARVNPGPENDHVDRYNPMVAVSPDGVVHVAYRQRHEAVHLAQFSPVIDTYYQESHDHGATWTAPLKVDVATADNNVNYSAFSRSGAFQGDYNEIASNGGLTYVVRDESYPTHPGEPVALTPDPSNVEQLALQPSGKTHQHQQNWVAVLGPLQAVTTPSPGATAAPTATATPQPTPGLANTGAARPSAVAAGLALVAALVLPGMVRRRGRASRLRRR